MPQNLVDVDSLIATLDAQRQARNLSWRQLAAEANVSASSLTRMQQGKSPDVNTFSALTAWLNIPAERFYTNKPQSSGEEDPIAVISTLLRGKKRPNPKAMKALQELINAAVKLSKELK
jgi:transcriptional regulator with XRE-family HTH domain